MRHINGLYTQRYNRLKKTDGPLFRGRYKAILVEDDRYQLQLSRYIHRNPLEARMLNKLESHIWSSYPNYISNTPTLEWLYRQEIYDQLGVKSRKKYQAYVEMGVDEEIAAFYSKKNQKPYLGSDAFRKWAYKQRETQDEVVSIKDLRFFRPRIEEVTNTVARYFKVDSADIKKNQQGKSVENIPRWVVMYLAQENCGLRIA